LKPAPFGAKTVSRPACGESAAKAARRKALILALSAEFRSLCTEFTVSFPLLRLHFISSSTVRLTTPLMLLPEMFFQRRKEVFQSLAVAVDLNNENRSRMRVGNNSSRHKERTMNSRALIFNSNFVLCNFCAPKSEGRKEEE
jgi:hypothetical protein